MKIKVLTDRTKYDLNEVVETHEKATNYRALMVLVSQGEAEIVGEVKETPTKRVLRKIRRK